MPRKSAKKLKRDADRAKILNVRLGASDEAHAKVLREHGVNLSELVRRALRDEARRLVPKVIDTDKFLADLYARVPDTRASKPNDLPDLTDGNAVSEAVRRQLKTRLRER